MGHLPTTTIQAWARTVVNRREFMISVSSRSDTSAYSGCARRICVARASSAGVALGGGDHRGDHQQRGARRRVRRAKGAPARGRLARYVRHRALV